MGSEGWRVWVSIHSPFVSVPPCFEAGLRCCCTVTISSSSSLPFAIIVATQDDLAAAAALTVFQLGTGVLEPPRFPTRIALLSLYLRTKEDEEEDELPPRFLILHCLSMTKLWQCWWFFQDIEIGTDDCRVWRKWWIKL